MIIEILQVIAMALFVGLALYPVLTRKLKNSVWYVKGIVGISLGYIATIISAHILNLY